MRKYIFLVLFSFFILFSLNAQQYDRRIKSVHTPWLKDFSLPNKKQLDCSGFKIDLSNSVCTDNLLIRYLDYFSYYYPYFLATDTQLATYLKQELNTSVIYSRIDSEPDVYFRISPYWDYIYAKDSDGFSSIDDLTVSFETGDTGQSEIIGYENLGSWHSLTDYLPFLEEIRSCDDVDLSTLPDPFQLTDTVEQDFLRWMKLYHSESNLEKIYRIIQYMYEEMGYSSRQDYDEEGIYDQGAEDLCLEFEASGSCTGDCLSGLLLFSALSEAAGLTTVIGFVNSGLQDQESEFHFTGYTELENERWISVDIGFSMIGAFYRRVDIISREQLILFHATGPLQMSDEKTNEFVEDFSRLSLNYLDYFIPYIGKRILDNYVWNPQTGNTDFYSLLLESWQQKYAESVDDYYNSVRYATLLAKLYKKAGDIENAEIWYQKALNADNRHFFISYLWKPYGLQLVEENDSEGLDYLDIYFNEYKPLQASDWEKKYLNDYFYYLNEIMRSFPDSEKLVANLQRVDYFKNYFLIYKRCSIGSDRVLCLINDEKPNIMLTMEDSNIFGFPCPPYTYIKIVENQAYIRFPYINHQVEYRNISLTTSDHIYRNDIALHSIDDNDNRYVATAWASGLPIFDSDGFLTGFQEASCVNNYRTSINFFPNGKPQHLNLPSGEFINIDTNLGEILLGYDNNQFYDIELNENGRILRALVHDDLEFNYRHYSFHVFNPANNSIYGIYFGVDNQNSNYVSTLFTISEPQFRPNGTFCGFSESIDNTELFYRLIFDSSGKIHGIGFRDEWELKLSTLNGEISISGCDNIDSYQIELSDNYSIGKIDLMEPQRILYHVIENDNYTLFPDLSTFSLPISVDTQNDLEISWSATREAYICQANTRLIPVFSADGKFSGLVTTAYSEESKEINTVRLNKNGCVTSLTICIDQEFSFQIDDENIIELNSLDDNIIYLNLDGTGRICRYGYDKNNLIPID